MIFRQQCIKFSSLSLFFFFFSPSRCFFLITRASQVLALNGFSSTWYFVWGASCSSGVGCGGGLATCVNPGSGVCAVVNAPLDAAATLSWELGSPPPFTYPDVDIRLPLPWPNRSLPDPNRYNRPRSDFAQYAFN